MPARKEAKEPTPEHVRSVLQVYGDSMSPAFNAAEYVLLKKINHHTVIQYGQPHFIKTTDLLQSIQLEIKIS